MGGSAFYGETAHGQELDGREVGGATLIWEGHLAYKARGWDLQALVAGAELDEVEQLNALKGLTGNGSIGESMLGWYVQAGYGVLRSASTRHQLLPYVRYEAVDTQRSVPAGYAFASANDLTILSVGMAWKPIANTVLKADCQLHGNRAETGVNQFNVSMEYLFMMRIPAPGGVGALVLLACLARPAAAQALLSQEDALAYPAADDFDRRTAFLSDDAAGRVEEVTGLGIVRRIEVLAFAEPPEYIAPGGWMSLFRGRAGMDPAALRRDVPNITGATLTANAGKGAVARALALHRVIDPEGAGEA